MVCSRPRSGCRSSTCARRTARWLRSGRPRGAAVIDGSNAEHSRAAGLPECGHGDGADRVEFDHRAEALAGLMSNSTSWIELRGRGHQPDGDAGAAADEGRQHDQPDFVGTNQCAQRLRRMQHRIAEGPPGGDVGVRTRFSWRAALPERPRVLSRQGVSTCATSSGPARKGGPSWNLRAPGSTVHAAITTECGKLIVFHLKEYRRSCPIKPAAGPVRRVWSPGHLQRKPASPRPTARAWRNPGSRARLERGGHRPTIASDLLVLVRAAPATMRRGSPRRAPAAV